MTRFIHGREPDELDLGWLLWAKQTCKHAFVAVVSKEITAKVLQVDETEGGGYEWRDYTDSIAVMQKGVFSTLMNGFWFVRDRLSQVNLEKQMTACVLHVCEKTAELAQSKLDPIDYCHENAQSPVQDHNFLDSAINVLDLIVDDQPLSAEKLNILRRCCKFNHAVREVLKSIPGWTIQEHKAALEVWKRCEESLRGYRSATQLTRVCLGLQEALPELWKEEKATQLLNWLEKQRQSGVPTTDSDIEHFLTSFGCDYLQPKSTQALYKFCGDALSKLSAAAQPHILYIVLFCIVAFSHTYLFFLGMCAILVNLCHTGSKVLAEADRLRQLCGFGEPCKPFGLGKAWKLENSKKRMRCQISKVAKIAGVDNAEFEDVVNAVMPSKKLKSEDQQSIIPIADEAGLGPQNQLVAVERTDDDEKPGYSRKQADSPLLSEIVDVVEYALSLPAGSARQKAARMAFPSILRSNILSKWIQKYHKYQLWLMPRAMASKLRAVPNYWVAQKGLNVDLKGPPTVAGIPREVAAIVDQAQQQNTIGSTSATKRCDPGQGTRHLIATIKIAWRKYNQGVKREKEQIEASNAQAWKEFKDSVLVDGEEGPGPDVVCDALKQLRSTVKKAPKLFEAWKPNRLTARRFNKEMANYRCRMNTQGNFLAYDDPRMELARSNFAKITQEKNIVPGLVLLLGLNN